MKLVVCAAVLLVSARSDARCSREHPHCGHVSWELGTTWLRFTPDPIDAISTENGTTTHVTAAPGDQRAIDAAGVSLRSVLASSNGLYIASGMVFGAISSGPRLVADVASRGTMTTSESTTGGTIIEVDAAVGYRADAGPVTLGFEVAPGTRAAHFTTKDLAQPVKSPMDVWFILQARARADVWLTPHVSVGAQIGSDLVRPHDVSAGLALGLHLDAFDGRRR